MQFRYYLDSIEELISYYEQIDEPCLYIKYTPKLFNKWSTWARAYKVTEQDQLRPMGEKLGPLWMRSEFTDLDDFYKFYTEIIGEKNE